tara:strand:- start:118 stop:585 length:468 start_codon:yes stop_codon:yes gene_type:complete
MDLDNWYVTEVWFCDQEDWNAWMVTQKNEQGDCLAESEHFHRKGDALRCARGYLNRGRCRYMSVETKSGKHQYTEASIHGEAKNDYAMKRREAHVTMRALDSVLWEDPRDHRASCNVAQRLWNSGLLNGLPLTESMLLLLDMKSQRQYQQYMEAA